MYQKFPMCQKFLMNLPYHLLHSYHYFQKFPMCHVFLMCRLCQKYLKYLHYLQLH
jgi:hypothetical protein